MPEVSRFYGIVIKMYYRRSEHNPPHFHAIYGEFVSEIDIRTLAVIAGDLPQKALAWSENGRRSIRRNCSPFGKISLLKKSRLCCEVL